MPKKFAENDKKAAGRERKAAAAEVKKTKAEEDRARKEEAVWAVGAKERDKRSEELEKKVSRLLDRTEMSHVG